MYPVFLRADETTAKLTECQSDLVQQRRKNVLLEKQIGKSKIEQGGGKSIGTLF